jgi:hypothetical protein
MTVFEQHTLKQFANDLIPEIINAIKTKKVARQSVRWDMAARQYIYRRFEAVVNASGRLADSVQDVYGDDQLKIICEGYIDKLIFGQEPGEPVDDSSILRWMDDKGLASSQRGAALIGTKINRFGSSIWIEHQGKDSGLFADIDFDSAIAKLQKTLADEYAENVLTEINIAA